MKINPIWQIILDTQGTQNPQKFEALFGQLMSRKWEDLSVGCFVHCIKVIALPEGHVTSRRRSHGFKFTSLLILGICKVPLMIDSCYSDWSVTISGAKLRHHAGG